MRSASSSDLPRVVSLVEEGIAEGLYLGSQVYVSKDLQTLADLAIGESRPGRDLRADDLMLWMSSTKPTAAVAFARLWEKGLLKLDDPVAKHVPEFGQKGKEGITLRHVLTHTGGFRMLSVGFPKATWDETIATICATKAEPRWVPGHKAGYHMASSWFLLGEVLQRIDGRPYSELIRQEVFEPLAMHDSWVGMSTEQYEAYGERIVPVFDTGRPGAPAHRRHEGLGVTRSSPGGNGYGPARDLGKFYEHLLALRSGNESDLPGRPILRPQTVEALVVRHRVGKTDATFRRKIDWGLGVILDSKHYGESDVPYAYGPHAGTNTFGHSGYRSSTAFADPDHCLVVALVTNGTPADDEHRNHFDALCGAVYEDLGLTLAAVD